MVQGEICVCQEVTESHDFPRVGNSHRDVWVKVPQLGNSLTNDIQFALDHCSERFVFDVIVLSLALEELGGIRPMSLDVLKPFSGSTLHHRLSREEGDRLLLGGLLQVGVLDGALFQEVDLSAEKRFQLLSESKELDR